ncbi:MAG: hypothetical protein ACTIJ9_13940 [Aequorivita sp.]
MSLQEPKKTENHEIIKNWVEERYGEPATVEGVVDKGKAGQMLRIHFPGHADEGSGETLEHISWETFYKVFDDNNLAFLYQEGTVDGENSIFYKIIDK